MPFVRRTLPCFALMLAAACSSSSSGDDEPALSIAGRATGSEVFIAIIAAHGDVFAYACDGTPAATTETSWFVGAVDGDAFSAANPAGSQLAGDFTAEGATGTLTNVAGTELPFTAATASGASGLYFGERGHDTEEIWGGWIVIGTEQRGAVVDRTTGDIVGSPSINPSMSTVDVDGAPLDYDQVDAPLGEALDDVPPG